jgi:type I restriction-modification system DNA methylase subunit
MGATAPDSVKRLVERFDQDRKVFLSSDYKEEQLRLKFLNAFSVMPADVLGQVYEPFLGKVIRLTAGHQAKVEEKPEVRKAGGVHYTPQYIVNYIVKNTIGKLLEGRIFRSSDSLTRVATMSPTESGLGMAVMWRAGGRYVARIGGTP